MTDMEGVCGVLDHEDWVIASGRYFEEGKRLLTLETNAAVEGFFSAGADEVYVVDGHGAGGINQSLLDKRTYLIKNFLPEKYPFMLDESFDAIAWVGQHAKAGTEYAHIAHTGWFRVIDYKINGISIGEFGQIALCAAQLGVIPIFGSGDEAFTKEAEELVKGIETVSVKKGVMYGSGDELDFDAYKNRNLQAIHMHPEKARELIKEHAEKSLQKFINKREAFAPMVLNPPFKRYIKYRAFGSMPGYEEYAEHPEDVIKLMNA
jgi:D-aminopeptidase